MNMRPDDDLLARNQKLEERLSELEKKNKKLEDQVYWIAEECNKLRARVGYD